MTVFSCDNMIVDHRQPLIRVYQSQTTSLVDHCRPYKAAKPDDKATALPLT